MNNQIERYTDLLSRELERVWNFHMLCRIDKDTTNNLINYKLPITPKMIAKSYLNLLIKSRKLFGRDPNRIGVYKDVFKTNKQ